MPSSQTWEVDHSSWLSLGDQIPPQYVVTETYSISQAIKKNVLTKVNSFSCCLTVFLWMCLIVLHIVLPQTAYKNNVAVDCFSRH